MESKNYSISEVELDPQEAKTILSKLIDAQINTYKLQSLQDWERNHKDGGKWKNEINKLINFKQRLREDLENYTHGNDLLKINFSLGVDSKRQHEIRKVG